MSLLKQGEINAIIENFEVVKVDNKLVGKINKNSVVIASNHETGILLRTNGLVVYGTYYKAEAPIKFTHDFMRFKKPFVKCDDYMVLKDVILDAWEKTYDEKAQAKLQEVRSIVKDLLDKHVNSANKVAANTNSVKTQKQDNTEQTKKETKKQDKREEKKEMTKNAVKTNKTVEEVVELNIMQMAHKIRRELKLEGHYHVQMKIAMNLAWEVKKGETSIEVVLNNTVNNTAKESAKANTYNAEQDLEKILAYFQGKTQEVLSTTDLEGLDASLVIDDVDTAVRLAIASKYTDDKTAKEVTQMIRPAILAEINRIVAEYVAKADKKEEVKAVNTSVKETNIYNAETDFDKVNKYFEDRVVKMCEDNFIHAVDAARIMMDTKALVAKAIDSQDTSDKSARDLTIAIRKDIFKAISEAVQEQAEINAIAEANERLAQQEADASNTKETVKKETVQTTQGDGFSYRVYLKSFKKGEAQFFCKRSDGAEKPLFRLANLRNAVHLDKEFAKKLAYLVANCPNNTTIEYYGQNAYLEFFGNEELKAKANSKGIAFEQGAIPSGTAA